MENKGWARVFNDHLTATTHGWTGCVFCSTPADGSLSLQWSKFLLTNLFFQPECVNHRPLQIHETRLKWKRRKKKKTDEGERGAGLQVKIPGATCYYSAFSCMLRGRLRVFFPQTATAIQWMEAWMHEFATEHLACVAVDREKRCWTPEALTPTVIWVFSYVFHFAFLFLSPN